MADIDITFADEPELPIELDSRSEFEGALIDMVRMHRSKSKVYGSSADAFQNFYNAAMAEGTTPLQCSSMFGAKHRSVKSDYIHRQRQATPSTDDAFLDAAVYAVIDLILYRRER